MKKLSLILGLALAGAGALVALPSIGSTPAHADPCGGPNC